MPMQQQFHHEGNRNMAINWTTIGTTLAGVTAGVPTSISSVFGFNNPDYTAELQICASILMAANNPALVAALTQKLETEQGIPAAALAVAMTLTQPGVDVTAKVLQIETLIKSGG